jgi:competence protein ComEA
MKRFLLLVVALLFSTLALAAVNINTATKDELDALPGIGPVKAQAIVDYRNANGPFKTPEDIMMVIGLLFVLLL